MEHRGDRGKHVCPDTQLAPLPEGIQDLYCKAEKQSMKLLPRSLLLLIGLALLPGCSLFRAAVPDEIPILHTHAPPGPLLAGAAVVDISPTEPVWMAGYGPLRTSTGVHDPLYARTVVLERGETLCAIVAVDLIGIQRQDLLKIHEQLPAPFEPHNVLVVATHNHAGPDTLGLWGLPPIISGLEEDYLHGTVTQGIAQSLEQAYKSRRRAELAATSRRVEAEGLMKNLRRQGLLDRELTVMQVRDVENQDPIATLLALACHPETLGRENTEITADFPAVTIAELEKDGGVGIYVSGALGGLVTPDSQHDSVAQEWQECERVGQQLLAETRAAVAALPKFDPQPAVQLWHSPLYLENQNYRYDIVRFTGLLDREFFGSGYFLTEVNLWALGGLRICTIPGEITPDLGLLIKATCGGEPNMLIGLANDELGYLLPEDDFHLPIYDYERTLCVSAASGRLIAERIAVLAQLANQFAVPQAILEPNSAETPESP